MTNVEVFRPKSGYFLAGTAVIGSILLVIQTIFYSNGENIVATIGWAVTIILASYWLFIHPRVIVFDEGITIHNPFQTVTVGWADVEDIDVQYSMSIMVGGKKIHAFAAPAPGRYHARTIHQNEIKGMRLKSDSLLRPGESPRTYSGGAAQLARARHEAFSKVSNAGVNNAINNHVSTPVALLSGLAICLAATLILSNL